MCTYPIGVRDVANTEQKQATFVCTRPDARTAGTRATTGFCSRGSVHARYHGNRRACIRDRPKITTLRKKESKDEQNNK